MVNFWLLLYGRQKPGAEQICAVITPGFLPQHRKNVGQIQRSPSLGADHLFFVSNTALLGYIERTEREHRRRLICGRRGEGAALVRWPRFRGTKRTPPALHPQRSRLSQRWALLSLAASASSAQRLAQRAFRSASCRRAVTRMVAARLGAAAVFAAARSSTAVIFRHLPS